MSVETQIAENHRRVRERIEAACARSGRSSADVTLVAVTKYAQPDWVCALMALGVNDLGESRPQQLVQRADREHDAVRWHLIGHLQRNKARRVLPLTELIHSVDSLRLLAALDRLADDLKLQPRVLLEVNVSGEESKHGFVPEELTANWASVVSCRQVCVAGLMTMAPLTAGTEGTRPVFRGLRELRDRLLEHSPSTRTLPELSMGMSQDFEVAVEEGATLVRVGSELFTGLATTASPVPSDP